MHGWSLANRLHSTMHLRRACLETLRDISALRGRNLGVRRVHPATLWSARPCGVQPPQPVTRIFISICSLEVRDRARGPDDLTAFPRYHMPWLSTHSTWPRSVRCPLSGHCDRHTAEGNARRGLGTGSRGFSSTCWGGEPGADDGPPLVDRRQSADGRADPGKVIRGLGHGRDLHGTFRRSNYNQVPQENPQPI